MKEKLNVVYRDTRTGTSQQGKIDLSQPKQKAVKKHLLVVEKELGVSSFVHSKGIWRGKHGKRRKKKEVAEIRKKYPSEEEVQKMRSILNGESGDGKLEIITLNSEFVGVNFLFED